MPKRRRSEDDGKIKRKRGAKEGSQFAVEMEDEKYSDDHMRRLQEVHKLELEKHELHDQVSHLQSKMARLKQEAVEARASANQSRAVAAAASTDLINCQLIVKQLRQENATLVGEVEKVAKLTEQCDILKYERDGLRGRLRAASAGSGKMGEEKATSSDSTKILEEKAEWYKKNFLAEQKKANEELEKSKIAQAEVAKLTEQCDILKYERDGLRGRLRAVGKMGEEKATTSDSTNILEEKAEWYKKSFLAEQKKLKEELEKSRTVQAELNNRIAALITQITRAECEKKSAFALLMKTKADCEKQTGRLSVELKNSLDAREKLNHSLDESDGARTELQSQVDRYQHEMANATEYVLNLEKEHGQMNESMMAERARAEKLFQALQMAEQHLAELLMGKQEKQEFPTSVQSSFASPNGQFFLTLPSQANAFQQYANAIRPPPLLSTLPGYMSPPNQYKYPTSSTSSIIH